MWQHLKKPKKNLLDNRIVSHFIQLYCIHTKTKEEKGEEKKRKKNEGYIIYFCGHFNLLMTVVNITNIFTFIDR